MYPKLLIIIRNNQFLVQDNNFSHFSLKNRKAENAPPTEVGLTQNICLIFIFQEDSDFELYEVHTYDNPEMTSVNDKKLAQSDNNCVKSCENVCLNSCDVISSSIPHAAALIDTCQALNFLDSSWMSSSIINKLSKLLFGHALEEILKVN